MSLGATIQQARKARGLRQSDLAEQIGKSTYYVSLIEQQRRRPSRAVAQAISVVLGVQLDLTGLRPVAPFRCGCGERHHAKGMCVRHYKQAWQRRRGERGC